MTLKNQDIAGLIGKVADGTKQYIMVSQKLSKHYLTNQIAWLKTKWEH